MPIYEYRCRKCGEVFEKFQWFNKGTDSLKCPHCGEPGPERIVSSFSSLKGPASGCGSGGGSTRFS